MENIILSFETLGLLERGDYFQYVNGKATYRIESNRILAVKYSHTETGEIFKLAMGQRGFHAKVKVVSKK